MPRDFQIYVDLSMRQPDGPKQQQRDLLPPQPASSPPLPTHQAPVDLPGEVESKSYLRCIREQLEPNQIYYFDERKLYPLDEEEQSFEELKLRSWLKRQKELQQQRRYEELELTNEDLRRKLEAANQQLIRLANVLQQIQQSRMPTQTITIPLDEGGPPQNNRMTNRLSIVPRSLQPDADTSCCGARPETVSAPNDWWKYTFQGDLKFTVPIDQSQYIQENVPTSTPNAKDDKTKRPARRMSRPSMGGSPTLKLSPITETSRDCNSKSSSSSSAMSTTPGTTLKKALVLDQVPVAEPDRPIDPNDPTTYRMYLRSVADPIERRSEYVRINSDLPILKNGVCFRAGPAGDAYLVDRELSKDAQMYTAQLLSDDSDQSSSDMPMMKSICFRVNQPHNDWLFYICNELRRRLVRQKTQPDIELSVMDADPALIFNDGSILIDEYFRFVPLEDYFSACLDRTTRKEFPKSVTAYVTLELLQIVKGIHDCGIIHMNINPKNIIVTGCPSREDILSLTERTSIIKLIGFDYATDLRILPSDHKFTTTLDHLVTCEMIDEKPWTYEVDWYGVLASIHKMLFLEEMEPVKDGDRWKVQKQFKGLPTDVWKGLFDGLLNIQDKESLSKLIDTTIEDLSVWIRANISFVLKEAASLDTTLEDHCKATNRSVRI